MSRGACLVALNPSGNGATRNVEQINAFDSRNHRCPASHEQEMRRPSRQSVSKEERNVHHSEVVYQMSSRLPRHRCARQGFPILKDDTGAGEHQSERLLRMSIKVAHLACDIANASPIHETQDGTIELSQQVGNRASTSLTCILA